MGIHPWHIASVFRNKAENPPFDNEQTMPEGEELRRCITMSSEGHCFENLLRHPQVLAVGEAGLDKLADTPLNVQMEIFRYQARLAEEINKPLIIHLVKAVDELLKLKSEIHPVNPWIIHGFRGKATLAEEYIRHGFYLSFGEKYQEEALRTVPPERLFLETDESTLPVDTLYERVAEVRRVSVEELLNTLRKNIDETFL